MSTDEMTILNEDAPEEFEKKEATGEETIIQQETLKPEAAKGKENNNKKRKLNKTAAVAAAVGGGVGSAFAAVVTDDNEEAVEYDDNDVMIESEEEQEEVTAETVQEGAVVNDDMSFGEAFAAARAAYGSGAVFEWHGNTYNTYTREEVEAQEGGQYAEVVDDVPVEVVEVDVAGDTDEVLAEEVQVIGIDSEDAIVIDDNETAFVAEVDEVYVEVYDDQLTDTSFDGDLYMSDDPMF